MVSPRCAASKWLLAGFTAVALVLFHIRFGTISWWNALRGNLALGRALSMSPTDHTTVQTNLLNAEYLIGYWASGAFCSRWLCLTAVLLLLLGVALLSGLPARILPYVGTRAETVAPAPHAGDGLCRCLYTSPGLPSVL